MRYTRIHRLLRLITLIQGSAQLNAAKLAEICSISERNIYRDLEELEGAGVPISFDKETGGYSLRRDFFLRPIDFTLEEALALVLIGREVGQTEQVPHAAEAGKAIDKLLATLPAPIREMVDELLPRMTVDLARTANEPTAEVYTRIRHAITNKRALQCEYESASQNDKSEVGTFRFDPYGLYFGQRAWYAVGLHHGHNQIRTLKLARLVQCKSLDKPYFIPDDFSLKKHFGQAWRMVPCGKLYDIHLHFDSKMAETVADTHWHDSQEELWNDDGSIEMRFCVDGLEEIIWWILSYGPHCRVIEPAELRARVAELHKKAFEQGFGSAT
jgi:predicted DNA-binding transcriptional regulator YafY